MFYSTRNEEAYSELYCSRCDAHLGKLLNQGQKDGMRYCVNGASMTFFPENSIKRNKAMELRQKAIDSPKELSTEDWELILTPEQFRVARMQQNEEPFSSGLENMANLDENGIFRCVCCEGALFDVSMRRNVDVGWPTFSEFIHKKNGGTCTYR